MSKPVVLCTAPTNPSATSATSQYHRSVQLSLKGLEEGTVFVDPSVLLSQQPKGVLAQESTGRTIFNFQEMTRIAPQKKPDVTPSIANIFTKSKHGVSKSSNKSVLPKLSLPGSEPPRKVLQLERKIEDVATATPSQVLPKIVTASQVSSSQSSSYQPSKRAKLMTAAFTPGAILASGLPQTTGNKNSILSAALLSRPITFKKGEGVSRSFQTVTSLAKTGPEKENQPADSENSSYTQNTASKLGCIICNESSTELRGAARCGHVCCLGCWTLWLKKSSTCPLCRAPTTSDDISKVYLKRAMQLSQSSEI